MANRLRSAIDRRAIPWLLHFTPASNVASIIEHGLQPALSLEEAGLNYRWTDPHRLDGAATAISLSIGSINWPMFDAVRERMRNDEWVVFALDPYLLIGSDSQFLPANAASGWIVRSWKSFRSVADFEAMFGDPFPGSTFRDDLPDHVPTDPQAEILHYGAIHPDWFIGAFVEDMDVARQLDDLLLATGRDLPIEPWEFRPDIAIRHHRWLTFSREGEES